MQCGLAGTVAADAGHSDGVLGLLSSPFLGKRKLHLGRDCSNEGIQRPSILIVIGVAVLNYFSHVANLEPYLHHRGPLDVVGLGEGRPPTTGTDVLDNCMDLAVAMVLIRGGRAAPPVEATISVDPTAATESTLARCAVGASAPIWATAARAPMGMHDCPLCCLLSRCLSRQP
jgi:hypothetical protein